MRLIFLGLFFCISISSFAQKRQHKPVDKKVTFKAVESPFSMSKNTVYAELGGNAFTFSFNYERQLFSCHNTRFSGRIGLGFLPEAAYEHFDYWAPIPIMINTKFLPGKHHIETGLGVTMFVVLPNFPLKNHHGYSFGLWPTPTASVSYRYESPNSPLMLKAGLSGILFIPFGESGPLVVPLWPEFAMGYRF